jgi:hypothetical protein
MARKIRTYPDGTGHLNIKAPVASGVLQDQVVLWSSGATLLRGYTLTKRTEAADITAMNAPQGLLSGEASVCFLNALMEVDDTIVAAAALNFGAVLYWDATNFRYTDTAAGNTFIGWYSGLAQFAIGTRVGRVMLAR